MYVLELPTTLSSISQKIQSKNNNISYYEFQANFDRPGSEFTVWAPTDWNPSPKFLENIRDPVYRQFARDVHGLWRILGRRLTDDVAVS